MKKLILIALVFTFGAVKASVLPPVIEGPTTVSQGQLKQYTYTNATLYPNLYWSVNPASVGVVDVFARLSNGYYSYIEWTGMGAAVIRVHSAPGGLVLASLNVTVLEAVCDPIPPAPAVTISSAVNACSPRQLSYPETHPDGVTWYWQTSSDGKAMTNDGKTYSAPTSGTYYIRAFNGTCWSATSASYNAVVNLPDTPPQPSISDNFCGPKTMTRGTPPAGVSWYWQTTSNGEDVTSAIAISPTYVVKQDGDSFVFLRARSSEGCWGSARMIQVTVENPLPPKTVKSSYTSCETSMVQLKVSPADGQTIPREGDEFPDDGVVGAAWYDTNGTRVGWGYTYIPTNKSVGTYTYTVKSFTDGLCESDEGTTITLNVIAGNACDNIMNWSEDIAYTVDGSGTEVPASASKVYADGFGTAVQSQARSYATNQVFATQSIYDIEGNQTLTTLPAPINSNSFGYREHFITNATGAKYSASDFDLRTSTGAAGEINNPKAVTSNGIGTLGWYYSSANTMEPNTPTTSYPYARSYSPSGPNPTTSKSAGPGNAYRMGVGHEVSEEKLTFTKDELIHYFSLENYFIPSTGNGINLIENAEAINTSGFYSKPAVESVSFSAVTQNNETYVKAVSNQASTSTQGVWPIEGHQLVTPRSTYIFRVKGYNLSTTNKAYLYVKDATPDIVAKENTTPKENVAKENVTANVNNPTEAIVPNTDIVWPGAPLPQGSANEGWVEATFTIPPGCMAVSLGILYLKGTAGDSFYVNAMSLTKAMSNGNALGGNKHLATDPDGKQTMTFVDANGRTLASALVTSAKGVLPYTYSNWSYTYYNDLGQVVATVAPNGVNMASSAMPAFVTLYKYDHLGRLIETTSADEGTTQFVYSLDGKIRFSQNQEQRIATPKRFSYTNYDKLDRLIESGEYREDTSVSGTPYKFEPHTVTTPASGSVLSIINNTGYAGVTRRGNNATAVRYNDTTFIEYDRQAVNFVADANHTAQNNTFGSLTKTKNANSQSWYSYDELGQLEWIRQSIEGLGIKTTDYKYDNAGNVIQVAYQAGQSDAFYHHYMYDEDQRLTEVWTSKNGTDKTLHARYEYYLHGPLKRLELAGNKQGIDYVYTINGALKSINHGDPGKDPGQDGIGGENASFDKDIFGQTMHYFDNDYSGAGFNAGSVSLTSASYPNQFGGNLQAVTYNSPVDANKKHIYGYQYDAVNQLTNAQWGTVTGSGTYIPVLSEAQKENVPAYDKNGNIQSLIRKGNEAQTTANYNYVYEANTNKLDKVNDNGTLMADYTYNSIGQMIQQVEGGKTMKLAYNAYGLTSEIRDGSNSLITSYHYDDRGDLAKKVQYNNGAAVKNIFYVQDASGNTLAIYEQKLPEAIKLVEVPIYGAGRIATYKVPVNTFFYEVIDHLGNVRGLIGVPEEETYTATMESGVNEEPPFKNISNTRWVYNNANKTAGGNESAKLTPAKPVGPAISFEVSPGDVVNMDVWAYYEGGNFSSPLNETIMITAIAGAFGGVAGAAGEAGEIFNHVNSGFSGLLGSSNDNTVPSAFLIYVVYDKNYVQKGWGSVPVTNDANTNVDKEHLVQVPRVIDEPGYIYICLYTRSNSTTPVYFDDLKVSVQHSPVVAGADYYPFGLVQDLREITDEKYRYGYQGQYSEKDTVTNLNEFELRHYNAKIGRWLSADPYGQFASPYVGMGNMPQMGTDPDGGLFGLGPVVSGALIGAAAFTVAGAIFDDNFSNNWWKWTLGGGGAGALGGAIYNASTYNLTGIGRTGKGGGKIGNGGGIGKEIVKEAPYIMFKTVEEAFKYMAEEASKGRDRVGHEYDDGTVAVFNTNGPRHLGKKLTKKKVEDNSYMFPYDDDDLVKRRQKGAVTQDKIAVNGKTQWKSVHGYLITRPIASPKPYFTVPNGKHYVIQPGKVGLRYIKDGRYPSGGYNKIIDF